MRKRNSRRDPGAEVTAKRIIISGDWWTVRRKDIIIEVDATISGEEVTAGTLMLGLTELVPRRITIAKDLRGMDYLNVLLHEGLHAILSSRPNISSFYNLNERELEVDILSKELCGYIRQTLPIGRLK